MKILILLWIGMSLSQLSISQNNSNQCKCCTEKHQQFGFWEGDWNTFTPDGKLAGTNLIVWQQDSCVLKGNWNGEAMVLKSEILKNQKGEEYKNRVTWTPNDDGSVRQLWEISNDNESTWTVVFDGLYQPKTK